MASVTQPEHPEEIDECFRRWSPQIYRFLISYTLRDRELTEDLVQETFLRATGRWAELRNRESEQVLAWLLDVASHAAVDAFRRNITAQKERPVVASLRPREADPCHEAFTNIALQRLAAEIERMPERRRLAALLKWRCGWKNAEIAEALQVSPGAITQLLAAAQATLKQALEGYVPFEVSQVIDKGEGI